MARIKDVAKEAGVAASTVSLVLNNKGYVSAQTRQKVEAAVQKLNYVPSEMARNLSLKRTKTIGVIVPSIAHPFFGELTEALEAALYHLGYKMMLCCTKHDRNAERTFVDMLNRQTMDGIIMGAHSLDVSLYEHISQPIIAFDRYLNDDIPIVHCNHQKGGQLAAQAMLKHNCHHVVQILGYQGVRTPANEYHLAFNEVMQGHNVQIEQLEMPWNAFSFSDFVKAAEEVFVRWPDADAILGADMSVISCMHVAKDRGLHIPDDLKLIAYDGTDITRMSPQTITAVRQPIEELAELAAEKITHLVTGETDNKSWVIDPYILQGETC